MRVAGIAVGARRPRIYYGWWIILAYLVMNTYWSGTLAIGLTVFFAPIRASFGWSAALLAAIFSIENLASSLLAPLVGIIFDRHGPRELMLAASALAGAGLLLLSRAGSLLTFTAAFSLLSLGFAIWSSGTGPAIAALWFARRRGIAMGIVVSGSSLGGVMVPFWSAAVDYAGWRASVIIAGVALLVISLPLCLLLRHRPEQYGLAPDGAPPAAERVLDTPQLPASVFRGAMRARRFWIVAATATAAAMGGAATNVHILPSLREAHVAEATAVAAVTAISLLGIPARLGAGWLGDRVRVVILLLATFALQATGLLLLAAMDRQAYAIAPAVLLFGVGSANVYLVPSLVLVRFFGTRAFGRIQGILLLLTGLGRVAGPIIAGAIRDAGRSYSPAYLLFAVLSLLACLPVLHLLSSNFPHPLDKNQ